MVAFAQLSLRLAAAGDLSTTIEVVFFFENPGARDVDYNIIIHFLKWLCAVVKPQGLPILHGFRTSAGFFRNVVAIPVGALR